MVGSAAVDPRVLQGLGKRAAALHGSREMPLTDAVVEVLRGHDLGREQVQRVVEFTNNAAFAAAFPKMAGSHRVVDFLGGPADPHRVAALLETDTPSGEEGAAIMKTARLLHDVERFVPGSALLEDESLEMEKRASAGADYPPRSPNRDLLVLWTRVKTAEDVVGSELMSKYAAYVDAAEDMCVESRRAILDGVSPASLSVAFDQLSPTPALTKLALKQVQAHVRDVPSVEAGRSGADYLVLDRSHPLCRSFEKFAAAARSYYTLLAAKEKLGEQREQLQGLLRERCAP